jgi:hypothetical protein
MKEIQKIFSVCSRTREKVTVLLLASTGMCIGVQHTLKVGDLEYGKPTIFVPKFFAMIYSSVSALMYAPYHRMKAGKIARPVEP